MVWAIVCPDVWFCLIGKNPPIVCQQRFFVAPIDPTCDSARTGECAAGSFYHAHHGGDTQLSTFLDGMTGGEKPEVSCFFRIISGRSFLKWHVTFFGSRHVWTIWSLVNKSKNHRDECWFILVQRILFSAMFRVTCKSRQVGQDLDDNINLLFTHMIHRTSILTCLHEW